MILEPSFFSRGIMPLSRRRGGGPEDELDLVEKKKEVGGGRHIDVQ